MSKNGFAAIEPKKSGSAFINEVNELLQKEFLHAKTLLQENQDLVKKLVKELLKVNTVDKEKIQAFFDKKE